MRTEVYRNRREMGAAAGKAVEDGILNLLQSQDEVRVVFAAAPSQNELLSYLRNSKKIPWNKIVAFHMDEYTGLTSDSPQLFSSFLRRHLFDAVPAKAVHFIDSNGGESEAIRYGTLLTEKPIDLVCLGIGENGHIAFNDPPVANFNDPKTMKVVALDQDCRQQQVNDGCFATIDEVPTHALTLTIPTLMSGRQLYCVVPGERKRHAVAKALHGPLSTDCPASILRKHKNCRLFLDEQSSGGLPPTPAAHE